MQLVVTETLNGSTSKPIYMTRFRFDQEVDGEKLVMPLSMYMYMCTYIIVIRRVQGYTVFINPRALSCSVRAQRGRY